MESKLKMATKTAALNCGGLVIVPWKAQKNWK